MLHSTREQFHLLFTHTVFLAGIFSWISAQLIKTIIQLFIGKIGSVKELLILMVWRTGGMPSSHSALVCAVTTSIGFHSGIYSDVFILSLCFAFVVIRDALGVRRASGIQAKTLNEIGKELQSQNIIHFKAVKEIHGHKPLEVLVGCFLGVFLGIAFSIL